MKKRIIFLASLFCMSLIAFSQCDKKVIFTGSKTEFLNADSSLDRTEEEPVTLDISKDSIIVTHGDEQLTGKVTDLVCQWDTPFKNGKTSFSSALVDKSGDSRNISMTINGKDGILYALVEAEGMEGKKIRVPIDKFEEKEQ